MQSFLGSIFFWRFLSWREGIGDALNIEDQGNTGKYPLRRGMLGLQLCGKHVRLVSVGSHVAGALVNTLVDLAFLDLLSLAVNQRHDRELLFGDGLIHERRILIPCRTFQLESEYVGSVFKAVEHLRDIRIPVHFLKHIGLDVQLVQTHSSLLGTYLLDGSEERVRLVKSVQEADGLVDSGWVILPQVKQLKSLLKVIQPRSKTSGSHPRLFGPFLTDLVEVDVLHEVFHCGSHCQLSLESKFKVLQVDDNLTNKSVD